MTSEGNVSIPRRIEPLDGLRGVAALMVLVHHAFLLIPVLAIPYYFPGAVSSTGSWEWLMVHTPLHLLWDGVGPVYIFFVLSGLVLALPVLKTPDFSWKAYYPQRLVRLYVPVWGAVALAVTTIVVVPRNGNMDNEWLSHHTELSGTAIIKDSTLLGGAGQVASPLWSLEWEVLFSMLLPLYVWLASKLPRLNLLKVALLVYVTCIGAAINFTTMLYLPMFMLGTIMAVEWRRIEAVASRINRHLQACYLWTAVVVAAGLLLMSPWMLMLTPINDAALDASRGLVLVGAALVVFIAWHWAPAGKFLRRNVIQWLGTMSFSLYLVHEPLVIAVAYLLGVEMLWLAIPAGMALSLLGAVLFFYTVERPSHILAKHVHRRYSAKVTTTPAVCAKHTVSLAENRTS